MEVVYRLIKEGDKNFVNELYEKLLNIHSSNVGIGYRLWRLVL